jgi:hypothetical protein
MKSQVRSHKSNLHGFIVFVSLSDAFINKIVNDSWQYLYQDLIQVSKSFWENVVIDLLNELFVSVKFQY